MDTSVHKQAISNVTGLQVGEREGVWVVKDATGWRELLAGEADLVTAEYDRLMKEAAVPKSITKIQAMRAMKQAGIWEQFNTALAANQDAADEWALAISLERHNAFVESIAPSLDMSDEQVDQLFIAGAAL